MKTDKEKTIEFLKDLDIGYSESDGEIRISNYDKNVNGYCMFFVVYEFDENGKLKEMGIWE